MSVLAGCSSQSSATPHDAGAGADAAIADTGAPGDGGADASGPTANFDWVGIVATGQSLAVGGMAATLSAKTQPFHNLKLSLGGAMVPPFDAGDSTLAMVPLVEPIRGFATTFPSAYPQNIYGETPDTTMADQISAMVQKASGGDYVTVHTVVGESGQGMSVIQKGAVEMDDAGMSTGRAYNATLFEAAAIARLAAAAGKTYGIGAIVITHGETDSGNSNYEAELVKLWSDYNADLSAITGQTSKIPMFVSQQHAYGYTAGQTSGASPATLAQWRVGVDHPGDIVCSGPKYQYPYYTDNVHLVTMGYDLLGEKYGEIFYQKVVLGQDWQPLQPTSVSRSGSVITVQFHVPVEPLTWDTVLPAPHQTALTQWAQGKGFEVSSGSSPLTISSVAISGDSVMITTSVPVPAGATLGYAVTNDGTQTPGVAARWGLLRDSDATVGATTGTPQPNYAVAFQMQVP